MNPNPMCLIGASADYLVIYFLSLTIRPGRGRGLALAQAHLILKQLLTVICRANAARRSFLPTPPPQLPQYVTSATAAASVTPVAH